MSLVCLAVSAATVSAQQTASVIRFSGTATATDTLHLIFYEPPDQPCGQYVNCPVVCEAVIPCPPGIINLAFLSILIDELQTNCPTLRLYALPDDQFPLGWSGGS